MIPKFEMSSNLRESAKQRIVEDMVTYAQQRIAALSASAESEDVEAGRRKSSKRKSAVSTEKYMVMVVDSHTLKVLSGACKNYNILEKGVTVVEQIEKTRQSVPEFDAIYFLSPSDSSVAALAQDFADPKACQYKRSHVFFSGKVSDKNLDTLSKSAEFVNRCMSFAELYLHYVPYDGRVFHSDQPLALLSMGKGGSAADGIVDSSVETLLSVCASLREKPLVRYQRASSSGLCEKIANGLKKETELLWSKIEKSTGRDGPRPRTQPATVLILDRNVDLSALFIHEFFYEAMVLDVLDGKEVQWSLGIDDPKDDSGNRATSVNPTFSYEFQAAKGSKEKRQTILSDQDELWARYRGLHFDQVRVGINKEVQEFSKKHATLASIAKGGESKGGDLLQALRSLPEYQEITRNYWIHLELANLCGKAVTALDLMNIADIEHQLATGFDDDGHEIVPMKLLANLTGILQHSQISEEEKVRLVLLYAVMIQDITEGGVQSLLRQTAGLKTIHQQLLTTLIGLGLPDTVKFSTSSNPKPLHRYNNNKVLLKKNRIRAEQSKLAVSRFVSRVTDIAESLLEGTLDESEYPGVDAPRLSKSGTGFFGKSAAPATGKNAAAQWGLVSANADDLKGRLIIFVVGGVTLNEVRTTEELAARFGADIFLGGSTVLTPKRTMEILWSSPR